jgi:hypothetical protein
LFFTQYESFGIQIWFLLLHSQSKHMC